MRPSRLGLGVRTSQIHKIGTERTSESQLPESYKSKAITKKGLKAHPNRLNQGIVDGGGGRVCRTFNAAVSLPRPHAKTGVDLNHVTKTRLWHAESVTSRCHHPLLELEAALTETTSGRRSRSSCNTISLLFVILASCVLFSDLGADCNKMPVITAPRCGSDHNGLSCVLKK